MSAGGPAHVPVLPEDVLRLLDPQPGDVALDLTVGGGGHARRLLRAVSPGGALVGMDRDGDALDRIADELKGEGRRLDVRVVLFQGDFRNLGEALDEASGEVDPALRAADGTLAPRRSLLDLGVSSMQLDDPERGFSFQADGPLDMRMDRAGEAPTAAHLVNTLPERELADLIHALGEERHARRVARRIVERRSDRPFETTADLAETVSRAVGRGGRIHPATRTFQALRIAVNEELDALQEALAALRARTAPGGRVAVIAFHSLEDRPVKHTFRDWEREGGWRRVNRRPVRPGDEETAANPRARSARLRVIERLEAAA